MGPTQTKIYWGTPEQQQAAYLADSTAAAQSGWTPRSFEQVPGSMHVTYERQEPDPPPPPATALPGPEADAGTPAAVSRSRSRDIWEPVTYGVLLAALILVIWAVFVFKPGSDQVGQRPPAEQRAVVRCSPAGPGLIEAIEAGLTVEGGGGLRDGYTISSRDHPDVYFVAARVSGMGMGGIVGLWATSDLGGNGALYSVNRVARQVSIWDDGGTTETPVSQLDDGAEVVVACADG